MWVAVVQFFHLYEVGGISAILLQFFHLYEVGVVLLTSIYNSSTSTRWGLCTTYVRMVADHNEL
ncbi:MAG: hypothetical protein H6545_07900 [Bacteroidales bacterium]|nr:hypothetical protein [Bacteroidales bacterium]